MSEIRMAKMKKAKDIKVGDKLVKVIGGEIKYAEVSAVENVISKKGGERIRISYGGFAIVHPDTEMEVA